MPDEVIDHVHTLAHCNKGANSSLVFGWRDGSEIEDDEDDEIANPTAYNQTITVTPMTGTLL